MFSTCPPENTPVSSTGQNVGKTRQIQSFTLHSSDSSDHRGDLRKTCRKYKILLKSQVKFYIFYMSSAKHPCELQKPKRWKNQVNLVFTLHSSDSSGHRGILRKTCRKYKILLRSQVKFYILYLSSANHPCDLYRPKRWKNQANLVFYLTLLGLQRSQGYFPEDMQKT